MSHLPADITAFMDAFVAAWANADVDGVVSSFNDDAVYHNVPMAPCVGIEEIRAFVGGFLGAGTGIEFEIVAQVIGDDIVMNERIDTLQLGGTPVALPVMGTFVFRDGRIQRWSDYFDMATFTGG